MTIKHHIILSATITVALIALIACQQKPKAYKEQNLENIINEEVSKDKDNLNMPIQNVKEKIEEDVKSVNSNYKLDETDNKSDLSELPDSDDGPFINLFVNNDFNEGLDQWGHDKNVNITEDNGKSCVELVGGDEGQIRFWQTVNTISGHVYKLSFKVKYNNCAAFAIFRDEEKNQERYISTSPSENWKTYSKDFKSFKDGKYKVFFSCKGNSKFYYSDVSIIDIDSQK